MQASLEADVEGGGGRGSMARGRSRGRRDAPVVQGVGISGPRGGGEEVQDGVLFTSCFERVMSAPPSTPRCSIDEGDGLEKLERASSADRAEVPGQRARAYARKGAEDRESRSRRHRGEILDECNWYQVLSLNEDASEAEIRKR